MEQTSDFIIHNYKITYASEFGFRTDENGIFDKDLNKISQIPQSYDLDIKSVRLISKELLKQDEMLNYNKIDLPQILNHYYSSLKALNSEFEQNGEQYLTREQISSLVQGFSTQDGMQNSEIKRIYNDLNELKTALKQTRNLNVLNLDNKIINFNFDSAINNTADNNFIKPYLSKNSSVAKSGLFLNFIYQDLKSQNENKANFFMNPVELSLNAHKDFYNLLDNKNSFEEFIKEQNKEKMSFDLYLYVNGVDKNSVADDKLALLFQQYVNYQHNINLQDFANSSSIFGLYMQESLENFSQIKQEYSTQNDEEKLIKANENKSQAMDYFLNHRKKQAGLNKILNSYLQAMA
ncbi:hypothetical protein OLQ22_09010 [Campylobacter jejuni]|nr:hypothetical protein [Campylobacter jejuni]